MTNLNVTQGLGQNGTWSQGNFDGMQDDTTWTKIEEGLQDIKSGAKEFASNAKVFVKNTLGLEQDE